MEAVQCRLRKIRTFLKKSQNFKPSPRSPTDLLTSHNKFATQKAVGLTLHGHNFIWPLQGAAEFSAPGSKMQDVQMTGLYETPRQPTETISLIRI